MHNAGAPIVVTCAHSRMGFNVARSLARFGRRVVAVGRVHPTMCAGQPGVIAQYGHDDPYRDPDAFIALLLEVAARHGVGTLFPVHEETYVVAEHKHRFEAAGISVCCPDLSRLLRLHDKANVPRLAAVTGVPAPRSFVPKSGEELEEISQQVGHDFIVKPRWGSGALGLTRVADRRGLEVLRSIWRREPPAGRYVVQERVPGCGAGAGVLVYGGRSIACAGHLRVREVPITGGTSSARVTLRHAGMLDAAQRLVAAGGFDNGVCMVEFRYDAATGRFWVLEFNPRYWGGLSTAIESGVDFPVLHLRAFEGAPAPPHPLMATRLSETRWLLGEIRAAVELARARRGRDLARVLRTTPGHRLYVEDFGPGRFRAFASEVRGYVRSLAKYGNFGQQSSDKDGYFDRLMTNAAVELQ